MKKRILKILSICVAFTMTFQLTGCSSDWNEEYAAKYAKASLDLICTGEADPDVEFADVEKEDYASWRQEQIDEGIELAGLESYGVSDEVIESFKAVIDKAMTKVGYDVGTASKTDDGFSVPITIHPVKLYNGIDQTSIQNEVLEMAENGEIDATDTEAIYDKVFGLFAEKIDENLDDPTYGDDYEMTLEITKDSDGNYTVTSDSINEFGLQMFDTTIE